jgi:poly(3-hydroxybutyrate) depolymerase
MKRAVPMMYFWGTVDPIERPGAPSPAERARRNTETWKGLNSCAGKPEILVKGAAERQTFHGKAPVVIWTVKGMGHCWPGVTNGPLEARILGPQNLDVSASTEIINFFDEHPLR